MLPRKILLKSKASKWCILEHISVQKYFFFGGGALSEGGGAAPHSGSAIVHLMLVHHLTRRTIAEHLKNVWRGVANYSVVTAGEQQ